MKKIKYQEEKVCFRWFRSSTKLIMILQEDSWMFLCFLVQVLKM